MLFDGLEPVAMPGLALLPDLLRGMVENGCCEFTQLKMAILCTCPLHDSGVRCA